MTNAARTYFYPSFTITANGGLTSTTIGNLFSPDALFASIVGGLAQPIFNQGLNRARLRRSEGLQQEYLYTYQQTMFTAGQEVSNALFSYQSAADKKRIRAQQLDALNKSVDYTHELLRAGFANAPIDIGRQAPARKVVSGGIAIVSATGAINVSYQQVVGAGGPSWRLLGALQFFL